MAYCAEAYRFNRMTGSPYVRGLAPGCQSVAVMLTKWTSQSPSLSLMTSPFLLARFSLLLFLALSR